MIKRELFLSILVVVTLSLVLLSMGRIPYCAAGDFAIWVTSPDSSHTSQHPFDPFSFTHFEHGLIFFWLLTLLKRRSLALCLLIESGWEILENSPFIIDRYRTATIALNYTGDSLTNSLGDLLSCALGYLFFKRFGFKVSLVLMLIIELTLLILMRDNLTTNVIMLLYPIEALKNWQSLD